MWRKRLFNSLNQQTYQNKKGSSIRLFVVILNYHTLSLNTSNRMFGSAIWDKFPEGVFENFEVPRVTRE